MLSALINNWLQLFAKSMPNRLPSTCITALFHTPTAPEGVTPEAADDGALPVCVNE